MINLAPVFILVFCFKHYSDESMFLFFPVSISNSTVIMSHFNSDVSMLQRV